MCMYVHVYICSDDNDDDDDPDDDYEEGSFEQKHLLYNPKLLMLM